MGGEVLSWRDVLHDGRVPSGGPEEVRRVRAKHLASRGWVSESDALAEMEERDRRLLEADHVVLWFEHDLYDQLQLLQILWLLEPPREASWMTVEDRRSSRTLAGERRAEAIVVDRYLGTLSLDEIGALWPERRPLEGAENAGDAWAAFTGDDPRKWTQVQGEGVLRFLPAAMRRLAEELPWTTDGLTRSERQWRYSGGDYERSQQTEEARFMSDELIALPPSDWLGGVERARWRWDPVAGVASPA